MRAQLLALQEFGPLPELRPAATEEETMSFWSAWGSQAPPLDDVTGLSAQAVRVAISNIGYGETTSNNQGRFLDLIGGRAGGEWCAAFSGYCYRRAAEIRSHPWPSWTLRSDKPELGAKALTKAMGKVGRMFTDPSKARPGDLVCWHRRTGPVSWKGHVGIVIAVDSDGIIETCEGNVGKYPAKVRRFIHDVTKERLYSFASLWRE